MLAAALEPEVDTYISSRDEADEQGHRLVVRNGHAEPRMIATGAGPIEVRRRGSTTGGWTRRPGNAAVSSSSCPLGRKSPKVAEVLPLMYLHGMSSATSSPRSRSSSARRRAVGLGDDPPHDQLARRAGAVRRAVLKASTTCTAGPTASTSTCAWKRPACAPWSSWACVLTGPRETFDHRRPAGVHRVLGRCAARTKRRGMRAPVVAVGDGALGLGALGEVFPEGTPALWVHKTANVLYALPKSAHPAARALGESVTPRTGPTPTSRRRLCEG